MTAKTRRIEISVDAAAEELITQAAQARGEPISSFVLRAAHAEAGRVLARPDVTLMSSEQFNKLLSSLDEPDEAPALRGAVQRRRRYNATT
ncbi:DUF1778 domain-containing protein [Streptosporangium sp. 'caverna']|uniref:type II toxin-antitoxin system TacA family antitoxin n=1 Tax=Streptosporangium sp. 'caverna' TaxID=2202249 RepID=UPI0013A6E7BC|nr:DUF1778 domain-containing protein [Streptosporangium sp. 'caverna']